MAKTTNLYVRIEPGLKEQAETIFDQLGIPFPVKLPTTNPIHMTNITDEELNSELKKGYDDFVYGRTKPVKEAVAEIRKDYGI